MTPLPNRIPGATLRQLMTGPIPARSPLTAPTTVPGPPTADTSDPAHWWPQYEEPIYAAVYAELRGQLLAGLRAGTLGEVVPC